jgi:hypothetical protein
MGTLNQRRTASGEVDHDETENRVHAGDSISPDSVTAKNAEATDSITDPNGTQHTGQLADDGDISPIQASGDVDHDQTTGGTDADAHHTKTSSASELSDVSADSVGNAHHAQTASGDIDHNQTTNRTHSGDSLSPDSVSADTSLTLPVYSTLGNVPSNLDEGTLVWVADEDTIYKETGT